MDEKERDELLISIGKSLVTLARTHVLLLDMVKGIYQGEGKELDAELETAFKREMTEPEAEPTGYHETATTEPPTLSLAVAEPIAPAPQMHAWQKDAGGIGTVCRYCGVEYGMQSSQYCRDGTTVKEGAQPHE